MRKFFLTLCLLTGTLLSISAQQFNVKVGYFSYNDVLSKMPEYIITQKNLEQLRAQYAAELKTAEEEFNEKYEFFLEQQATLAEPIRKKRQADLQALLERNTQFRKEAERLIAQAENEAMTPLHEKLNAAIKKTGASKGYIVMVNTDSNAIPYFNENIAEDATTAILSLAK